VGFLTQETEPTADLIPATTNALCPASHFRNPFPSTQDMPFWCENLEQPGDPNAMKSPPEVSETPWAQVQGVGRQHGVLEIIYVKCALHQRELQVAGQEENFTVPPMCTSKYICKWGITAHGSPTKQSRFRLGAMEVQMQWQPHSYEQSNAMRRGR
jgi:hypothetical protein